MIICVGSYMSRRLAIFQQLLQQRIANGINNDEDMLDALVICLAYHSEPDEELIENQLLTSCNEPTLVTTDGPTTPADEPHLRQDEPQPVIENQKQIFHRDIKPEWILLD